MTKEMYWTVESIQPASQPINQPANQTINQSIIQINQPTTSHYDCLFNQPTNQPITHSINQPINRSVVQINQSINQSITQYVAEQTDLLRVNPLNKKQREVFQTNKQTKQTNQTNKPNKQQTNKQQTFITQVMLVELEGLCVNLVRYYVATSTTVSRPDE